MDEEREERQRGDGRKGWRIEWREVGEEEKERREREKLEEISLALWRGQRGEGPLIGGHYLNHVKRQNCIYLFKWIFGGRRAALTGALQPPAKLIYRRMSGNALLNLPAAGQVLSRPCATTSARYVRGEKEFCAYYGRWQVRGSRFASSYKHSRINLGLYLIII